MNYDPYPFFDFKVFQSKMISSGKALKYFSKRDINAIPAIKELQAELLASEQIKQNNFENC